MIDSNTPEDEISRVFGQELQWRAQLGEKIAIELPFVRALCLASVLLECLRRIEDDDLLKANVRFVFDKLREPLARTPAIAEALRRGELARYDRVHSDQLQ